jgi:hypothetical protein
MSKSADARRWLAQSEELWSKHLRRIDMALQGIYNARGKADVRAAEDRWKLVKLDEALESARMKLLFRAGAHSTLDTIDLAEPHGRCDPIELTLHLNLCASRSGRQDSRRWQQQADALVLQFCNKVLVD